MSTLPTRPPLCLNIKITNRIPLLNDYSPIDEMSLNFASDFDPNVVKYYRVTITLASTDQSWGNGQYGLADIQANMWWTRLL